MNSYKVVGVMSGSSLDGLDLAACEFTVEEGSWRYRIDYADTIPYPPELRHELSEAIHWQENEIQDLHLKFGKYVGSRVKEFCTRHNYSPEFISSHGHTIFHQPENRFTLQIGDGNQILKASGIAVINDFRTLDVKKGGQGAPLVPVGDELLFGSYDYCLNLGGIANISLRENNKRIAYDICPVNMSLNYLARQMDLEYDNNGRIAEGGHLDTDLLEKLNQLSYYQQASPKSLGYEWFRDNMEPLIKNSDLSTEDKMNTLVEHISTQISYHTGMHKRLNGDQKILVTGGGAFNNYLIKKIEAALPDHIQLVIPNELIISFKEALVFALLGVLRVRNEVNCLSSVTGAESDSSAGEIYGL